MVKRKDLTSDDLLRRQEQSQLKRLRFNDRDRKEEDGSPADAPASSSGPVRSPLELNGQEDDSDFSDEASDSGDNISNSRMSERMSIDRLRIPQRIEVGSKLPKAAPPRSTSFSELGVSLAIQNALKVMSIRTPTEIQAACIPPLLAGRDCIGNAKTGSGKTLAFALPIIQKLSIDPFGIFALVLTPTSFVPELSYLFNALPKDRQTCLFTATLTTSIENVANTAPRPGKQKPFIHRMTEKIDTVATLKQSYILVPSHVRESYLFHFLCNPPESTLHLRRAPSGPTGTKKQNKSKRSQSVEDEAPEQPPPTIIFCARPRTAAYLTLLLKTLSIRSTALHSRLTQRERLSSLSLFRSSIVPVLISTDVGARGLDIEDVAIVINWDLPEEPEEYIHRVGRTARAGKGGIAVSFVTERDEDRILKIEDRIGVKLEELVLSESKILEKLNAVSTAKRLANMELHDSNFEKRERINRLKTQI
ncbi:hypothetical protein HHX47_DHR5000060 [Lentinula edodes]|nr:hypothetical protein HHX47_DHR5000060 [Lentinula edodes]